MTESMGTINEEDLRKMVKKYKLRYKDEREKNADLKKRVKELEGLVNFLLSMRENNLKISPERKAKLLEVFRKFDTNNNGFVERTELPNILKTGYQSKIVNMEEINYAINLLDSNQSGKVSFDDFLKFMVEFTGELSDQEFYKGIDELLQYQIPSPTTIPQIIEDQFE